MDLPEPLRPTSATLCPGGTAERIAALLPRFDLPLRVPAPLDPGRLAAALELDKKAVASGLRLVLLRGIGAAVVDRDSDAENILNAMENNRA